MLNAPLRTKFFIPPTRAGMLARPRLTRQLDKGLQPGRRLVLVCAPAGYGKTTLVSNWISDFRLLNADLETSIGDTIINQRGSQSEPTIINNPKFSWLSLEAEDDDLARFLGYLIAAIQNIEPGAGEAALALVEAPRPGSPRPLPVETLLNSLVNELAQVAQLIALVLEDYHFIHAEPIHQALAYLLEHLPPNLHLILTSRAEPPLPLARLRGRGQLVELRATDLRFSEAEVAEYFNQSMRLNLDPEKVARLADRTEGWIAGLQMAAALLASRDDIDEFLDEFTGGTRYIMDYLVEEVLAQQPEPIQQFLLCTSILERMNAPLCEVMTVSEGSGEKGKRDRGVGEERSPSLSLSPTSSSPIPYSNCQQILAYLERSNLFVVPLDGHQEWYRYHHLMADLLRKRLEQASPDLVPVLHERASRWFDRNGYLPEAIGHSLSAGDFERTASLIEQAAEPTLSRSHSGLFLGWVERIPEAILQTRPALCVFHALALLLSRQQVEAIEARLQKAQAGDQNGALAGEIAALRALLEMLKGEIPKSIELSRSALEQLSEERTLFSSLAADNLGMCYVLSGDSMAATQAFEGAARIAQRSGNKMVAVAALSNLAGLQVVQGHLRRAWESYQEILTLATDRNGRRLPAAGRALIGLGELAREMNDLEAAGEFLTEAIDLFKQFVEAGVVVSFLSLARVRYAQGDWDGAWELLQQAGQLAQETTSSQMDNRLVEVARARLWIQAGKYEEALFWARERKLDQDTLARITSSAGSPGYDLAEPEFLILARLYLAQGQPEKALEILTALLEIDAPKGRARRMVELLGLQALALQARGESRSALVALQRALELARPEGYVRTFIDEGLPMQLLILNLRLQIEKQSRSQGQQLSGYLDRLSAAFMQEVALPQSEINPASTPPQESTMVEPLSRRELEVLALIAQGLTNSEIAARLVISLSTVKGHTANIYGKLGVNKRTQAVARARELGLIN